MAEQSRVKHRARTAGAEQEALLDALQRQAFQYFLDNTSAANGLVADSTWAAAPSSIAAVGFGLASYAVAVERGFMTRADALDRVLLTLRFFRHSPQSPERDATGYQGFFYHFLDMQSGRRVWQCELSTIDTACLLAGALVAAQYFSADDAGAGGSSAAPSTNSMATRRAVCPSQTTARCLPGWRSRRCRSRRRLYCPPSRTSAMAIQSC
jgi:hypothetical protein